MHRKKWGKAIKTRTTTTTNNQQLQHHQNHRQARGSSRLGFRTSGTSGGVGGEIVEVEGGHIVRSTSRKDRHSKVCTAKGPRDRRVRLSAHTAIQFYDVQDRLGYDRPSKAVDWLIKKAKIAIDKLAELPAWKPTVTTNPNSVTTAVANFEQNSEQNCEQMNRFDQLGDSRNSSFLVQSLDSDSIGSSNLFSRTTSQNQDLRLSLQSFQDPILHHPNHHRPETQECNDNGSFCFDGSGWSDNPTNPANGFQRTVGWGGDSVSAVSGGFVFGSQTSNPPFLQPLFGQTITSELFNNSSQREPLQSSTVPSFRACIDPMPPFSGVGIDQQHPTLGFHRLCSGLGGFSGLGMSARIEGEQEEHDDGVSDRPSSASSDSHH